MTSVAIFAPSPVLTVTIEDHGSGPDVHVHAGGQGLWQARMLATLGIDVTLCSALIGETGRLVAHLLADEGFPVLAVERDGRGAAYVHDRRDGDRIEIAETGGDALTRHDLDELYGRTLHAGLEADAIVLSGPAGDDSLPADVYRRLAADLGSAGRLVIADLAGERLDAALEGGLAVVKVSDQELVADGRAKASASGSPTEKAVIAAMRRIAEQGATSVIVTCSELPTFVLHDGLVSRVDGPRMQVVDTRGAGDSLTAGVTAVLAAGGTMEQALTTGTAAGALNVTRHGLGSGDPDTIRSLEKLVTVTPLDD